MAAYPPYEELGGVLPLETLLLRTPGVVITIPYAIAYRAGCVLHIEVTLRRTHLPEQAWGTPPRTLFGLTGLEARELQDQALLFGVAPPGGSITWEHETASCSRCWSTGRGTDQLYQAHIGLWLAPLPTAPFDLAARWQHLGVSESHTRIDSTAIQRAAQRGTPLWPDDADAPPPLT